MTTAASSDSAALEILPGSVSGPFDFPSLFGNARPVELEIGTGKGRFLLAQAGTRPEVNFLGVEWSLKYLRVTKDRAERRGLRNVRLFRADARHVLQALVPDESIARVHVYCPDPWPKKRHRKRRFFSPATLAQVARILVPGGFLDLSTDVREYFEEILEMARHCEALRVAEDPLFPPETGAGRTSYEAKYLDAGRSIHRASFARSAGPSQEDRPPLVRGSRG
jgi:tRNA (guanine-N7-)-methyltransferase